ncbi:MAG: hypothetical protein ACO1RT_11130, partial [Planctomycetaceae bacterium]
DADGDGQWTPAKAYAEKAWQSAGDDFAKLLQLIERYDASTAAFAAHFWSEAGGSIRDESAVEKLRTAPLAVQRGFQDYARSQRDSLDAGQRR